jgi:Gamma-glutamyltransferase
LSSIIVEKSGKPMLALGISGGHFRPQQHAMLLTNIIDLGMDVVEAIDAPRFLWDGAEVFAEDGVDAEVRKIKYPGATGVAHAIQFINDEKVGYADIRGDGVALGQY